MKKGVIFDLDGVIVDTAPFHYLAWKEIAGKLGIQIDEEFNESLKGIDRYNTFRSTAQELGIDDKFKAEYQNIIDALQNTFKISEAQGISLADMSNSDFTNYYLKIKEYGKAVQ